MPSEVGGILDRSCFSHAGWCSSDRRDEGVSGAKGRDKRPGYDALLKAVGRKEFDLIAACDAFLKPHAGLRVEWCLPTVWIAAAASRKALWLIASFQAV